MFQRMFILTLTLLIFGAHSHKFLLVDPTPSTNDNWTLIFKGFANATNLSIAIPSGKDCAVTDLNEIMTEVDNLLTAYHTITGDDIIGSTAKVFVQLNKLYTVFIQQVAS